MMFEANLDGLVGPTHNYAGLSFGNEASAKHAGKISYPRKAALQGLAKMRLLHDLGVRQLVMPPHPRPYAPWLTRLGFAGTLERQIAAVAESAPELLPVFYSSSGMWAANAATVCPSADAEDGKVHFTPANLISTAHRAVEPEFTSRALKAIFPPGKHFKHHPPLPASPLLADEGAANHMRLGGREGLHVFVYGRKANIQTGRYPARQSLTASEAVARLHGIPQARTLFVQQKAQAIDSGVFHNDVISTSHANLLLYHEQAFEQGDGPAEEIKKRFPQAVTVPVSAQQLPLAEAVSTYLFNSQIVSAAHGMVIIAPQECAENVHASALIAQWVADGTNPISAVHYVDLRESMQNGGGPACLRLRVQLAEAEWQAAHAGVKFTLALEKQLIRWVEKHYRERLDPRDLADPKLASEAAEALDHLSEILGLEGLYDL